MNIDQGINNRKGVFSESFVLPFDEEEKRVHSLFLSANFMENLGITNGKIGIALFFFSLYRRTHNELYENFAFELLDEVDEAINERTLVGFRFGLCGIGWGIEYLVRERYVGVEEDICAHFEHRIHHFLLYDLFQGIGVANGLCGVLLYLLARIESSMVKPDSERMFTNKRFIIYALDKLSLLLEVQTFSDLVKEKDNDAFGEEVPLVLSNWDYPVLIWVLGRVCLHGILKEKIEKLLKELLEPLKNPENWPDQEINRKLLTRTLSSLLMLESSAIKEGVLSFLLKESSNGVGNKIENDETDVMEEFFRFTSEQNFNLSENINK